MKRYIAIGCVVCFGLLLLTAIQLRKERGSSKQTSSPTRPRSDTGGAPALASSHPKPVQNSTSEAHAQTNVVTQTLGVSVSPLISIVVGKSEQRDFRSRLEAISALRLELSAEERQALYDYLLDPSEEKWLRPGQSFALKNDILNILQEQLTPPDGLTEVLLALRRNSSQPLVMRDYALQHMAPWFGKVGREQREKIVEELHTASQETEQSYAGTALLALHRIQWENPEVQIPPLKDEIVGLIDDDRANLLARISAVQLSGRLKLTEARKSVERIAGNETEPQTLRVAAIGALGRITKRHESHYLNETAKASNERLKHAAISALRHVEKEEKH